LQFFDLRLQRLLLFFHSFQLGLKHGQFRLQLCGVLLRLSQLSL
jgi:hypothetical protein